MFPIALCAASWQSFDAACEELKCNKCVSTTIYCGAHV